MILANKQSKVKIIIRILLLCILLMVLFIVYNLCEKTFDLNKKYSDDWAVSNYGQTINNSKGMKGVDINILPILNSKTDNDKVIVAVVDTGVEYNGEALFNNMYLNVNDPINGLDDDNNGYKDDYYGWNFYDNNNLLFEDALYDYHGTYISTTIVKIAPNTQILSVKFMRSTLGTVEDAILAINYAIDRGAKIINCSWNFSDENQELYNVIKNNPQVLFVCSAGNSNMNLDNDYIFPCNYSLDNIVNVMAIDNKGTIYEASGYGKETVHIASPGVDVKVLLPENEETYISGTSIAAAFVSATASRMMSINKNLTPIEIKDIIVSNAHKTDNLRFLCSSGGFIDVASCLNEVKTFG